MKMDQNLTPLQITDEEPTPGSIILIHGETGTAVQRFHGDGKYHAMTGKVYTWSELFAANIHRDPLLVYRAPEDEEN